MVDKMTTGVMSRRLNNSISKHVAQRKIEFSTHFSCRLFSHIDYLDLFATYLHAPNFLRSIPKCVGHDPFKTRREKVV